MHSDNEEPARVLITTYHPDPEAIDGADVIANATKIPGKQLPHLNTEYVRSVNHAVWNRYLTARVELEAARHAVCNSPGIQITLEPAFPKEPPP